MLQQVLNFINLCLFVSCVYFIKKTEACPCPEVEKSKRQYILLFSYFMILYLGIALLFGKSLINFLLRFPVLFIPVLSVVVGIFIWAIFTLQHIAALRKCKCPESIVEDMLKIYAIIELIINSIMILFLGMGIYQYNVSTANEKKLFRNIVTSSMKNAYK